MRHNLLYILFLLISLVCQGQDYKFEVTIKPAFIENADITIKYSEDSVSSISIKNFDFDEERNVDNEQFKQLNAILKSYKFTHSNNIRVDTFITNGDTLTMTILGFDGVTVCGVLTKDKDYKTFAFWSPSPKSPNGELISCLFALIDSSFQEIKIRKYMQALKGYFSSYSSPESDDAHIKFMIKDDIYMIVEKMPKFKGSKESLETYIRKKLEASEVINSSNLTGKIYVNFVIDEYGNILNPEIFRSLSPEIGEEYLKIVAKNAKGFIINRDNFREFTIIKS